MKAKITDVHGETIEVEGTPEEIARLKQLLVASKGNVMVKTPKPGAGINELQGEMPDDYPSVDDFLKLIKDQPDIIDKQVKFSSVMKFIGKPLTKKDGVLRDRVYGRFRMAKKKYLEKKGL